MGLSANCFINNQFHLCIAFDTIVMGTLMFPFQLHLTHKAQYDLNLGLPLLLLQGNVQISRQNFMILQFNKFLKISGFRNTIFPGTHFESNVCCCLKKSKSVAYGNQSESLSCSPGAGYEITFSDLFYLPFNMYYTRIGFCKIMTKQKV